MAIDKQRGKSMCEKKVGKSINIDDLGLMGMIDKDAVEALKKLSTLADCTLTETTNEDEDEKND